MTTDQIETVVSPVYQVFLPIAGFEGFYEVSNFGRVRSVHRYIVHRNRWGKTHKALYRGKALKQKINKYGYPEVCIMVNGRRKYITVHRLVASSFILNPKDLPQVNHKNCNKRDNSATNLEWTTPLENILHSIDNNLQNYAKGEQLPQASLTEIQVKEIKKILSEGAMTQRAIARKFGVGKNAIYHISKGNTWKTV